jgi:hypothetical protein
MFVFGWHGEFYADLSKVTLHFSLNICRNETPRVLKNL